ncbi:ATP-binding protein [Colwellia sp. 20A7]|uniref:sensor histidine kinase n=1 Tax=Colwellia sp. 20A7 TaxID=2689569 RepID=UPI00135B8488
MILRIYTNTIIFYINDSRRGGRFCISIQEYGNNIDIIVKDNGIGFESKHVQKIFSPFNRFANDMKFGGSGLGLSIVKRIIEHHNGNIEAHSELGVSSQFTLRFNKE